MAYFYLHLTSNSSTFYYNLPYNFDSDYSYEIALLKLDGCLENNVYTDENNNNLTYEDNKNDNNDNVFIRCNLISDVYVNERKLNAIFRFKPAKNINIAPNQIIYHNMINKPTKIKLDLVDENGNLVNYDNISITVELRLKSK